MKRLIISAPFGNYVQPEYATATLGTFTLKHRGGFLYRLWRCARTLRYSFVLRGWVNKLGLPNPGIESIKDRPATVENRIVSVHGFNRGEWCALADFFGRHTLCPEAVELNVSCPNVGDTHIESVPFERFVQLGRKEGISIIVKLPPINYVGVVLAAAAAGITRFHCCNTLPHPDGGVSGKPLKALSLSVVAHVRRLFPEAEIIGGGGITTKSDIDDYLIAGANRVAVGSFCLSPVNLLRLKRLGHYAAKWETKDDRHDDDQEERRIG